MKKQLLTLTAIILSLAGFSQHFSLSPNSGCGSAEVSFTNLHPSAGYTPEMFVTTGFTYSWDFGNGNTSTAENPGTQTYNTLGSHDVTYTVNIDTIGFELTKIVVDGYLGCDDPWPATNVEVYLLVKDNNGNQLINTEADADSYSGDPEENNHFEWTFGAINIGNDIPLWLEIWDNDTDIIDSDDNCIDDGEGTGTSIAMTLPPNNATGFFETTKVYTATTTNGTITITAYFNKPVIVLSQTLQVDVFPVPGAPSVDQNDIQLCFGEEMPVITATGNDIVWYDDEDLTNIVQSGNVFSPVLTDADSIYTYYLTQTDAINSCTSSAQTVTIDYTVVQPPTFAAYSESYCYGEIMPTFSAVGSNVKWYSDEALTTEISAENTLQISDNFVGEHTYYCTQSNAEGTCVSDAAELSFTIIDAITADVTVSDVNCFGASDGSASVTVTQGTAPYTYLWSNGDSDAEMTGVPAGDYTITVRDNNFCLAVFDAVIGTPSEIVLSALVRSGFCPDDTVGSIETWAHGGVEPYTYLWSDNSTDSYLQDVVEGTYTLTLTDAHGCEQTISETITKTPAFVVTSSSTEASCPENSDGSIVVSVSGATSPYEFSWSNGGIDTVANELAAGTYVLTITDFLNCRNIQTYQVENTYNICLVPSNVFTPNGDGKNDTWKILFIEMNPQTEVFVYSRSGKLVYNATGYESDWDGTDNGKNLPTGSYMYILDMKDGSDPMRGYVDIIR